MRQRLRQYLPKPHKVKNSASLRFLAQFFGEARLWQLNRRSIANACAIGMFAMWIPIPIQMIFAAIMAIVFKANLPLSVALVWVTNPFTIPLMFYAAYLFGAWALQHEVQLVEFSASAEWLANSLGQVLEPFLFGSLLLGIIGAIVGYFGVHIGWRIYIFQAMKRRSARNGNG